MATRVLSQERYKYTPDNFDKDGQFIRNPKYMMGPMQAQAVQVGEELGNQLKDNEFDLQQQVAADARAQQDANRAYRDLGSEEEAQRLHSLMTREGARESMGEENWARRMGSLKAWRKDNPKLGTNPTPSLATSPLPTGIDRLDYAGQSVPHSMADGPYAKFAESTRTYPELDEDLPEDHPDRMRLQLAQQGVDMTSGGPLSQRAIQASTPSNPRQRAMELRKFYAGYQAELPPDLQEMGIKYDPLIQELLFLQPDKQERGKWRWTTMEGTGIELGDLGDMLDPAEILSLSGSIGATVFTPQGKLGLGRKLFTMGFKGQNARMAAAGLEGGLGGRLLGEAAKIGLTHLRTNGESYPTYNEMINMGFDGAQIELFASVAGELGAKIMRTASNFAQDKLARIEGRDGVYMSQREVDLANKNIMIAKADMEQVKDVLGEYRIPMTVGEASGSIPLLVAESTAIKNASTNVKSMYLAKQAEGNQAVRDYVNEVYGDVHYFGDTTENVIIAANDALASNGKIAVAQTADGVIHFTPRASRNMNGDIVSDAPPGFGIDVEIKGAQNSAWQVKGSNLKNETTDLTNTGIGGQMYYHAMKEAQMHGGHLVSDSTVSGAASRVWENLGEESSNTIIKRHKDAVWDKDTKSWSVQSGEPVYEVVQKKSYTEALLDAYKPTTRATKPRLNTATGEVTPGSKVRTAEHFDRHLHNPGQEVANMRDDIAINPYVKQRYKEMVLDNYRTHTTDPKTGKVDGDKVTEWLDSTRTNLYNVFTKEEMFAINKGQLPSTVEATRASLDQMDGAINRIIDIDLGNLVKDGGLLEQASKKDMVSQMRALEPVEVRRLFKMLDNVPGVDRGVMGDHIRAMVQDDIRMELLQKVGGQNYLGMDKWMKSNEDLLHSIYPGRAGEVMMHLRMVRNTIKRNYDVAQVTGTASDQNPTGLALTRVVFGPLSRAQRFFSAARRGQVRGGAAKASELILDPDALRLFARIRSSDVESRVVAKAVQDMGGWDLFPVDINKWIPMAPDGSGGEEFDSNNPSHRKAIAGYVGHLLALENDWNAQNK